MAVVYSVTVTRKWLPYTVTTHYTYMHRLLLDHVNCHYVFLQVFQYDGTLSCTGIELGLFVLVGLALVVFFVAPAPLAVGYICRKRPLVSLVVLAP